MSSSHPLIAPATSREKSCRSSAAIAGDNMALEEYSRKRDFKKTPEPPPGRIKTRNGGLSHLVQKHVATRLQPHFRLDLHPVLLSRALPKGPSPSPADSAQSLRTAHRDL